jgi:wobble nucleotide-excising tRNase
MIRKIRRIKSFGVFADFRWPADLPVFNRYNIIYGWNYSGKTTLARALRCFELAQSHPDFANAEAELEMDGGATCVLSAPANAPPIRVFNSDFVRDNLEFDECQAQPILLLGQEDLEKQRHLVQLKAKRDEVDRQIAEKKRNKQQIEDGIEKALTEKAKDIKVTLSWPDYAKTHFRPKVEAAISAPQNQLLDESQFQSELRTCTSTERKPDIDEIQCNFRSVSTLKEKLSPLLKKTVTALTIQRLQDNPKVEQWVNQGRALHAGKKKCEFCESALPDDLLIRLAGHFSTEYETLMADLNAALGEVESSTVDVSLPDTARFYQQFADRFTQAQDDWARLCKERKTALETLAAAARDKQAKAFTCCDTPDIEDPTQQLQELVASINDIICAHNNKTAEFETSREKARKRLEKHYAAQFAQDQQCKAKRVQMENLKNELEEHQRKCQELSAEIQRLEAELSDTAKGAERMNACLSAYFGRDDLRIEVSPEKRFQITRGSVLAKNLSEGEETAIAFAYFITRLSDRNTTLADSIVVIDDPVSSLDANHLFNAVALIKTQLEECKQLIVATHHYEFFNLVRDWFNEIEELKQRQIKDLTQWRAYLVERRAPTESSIREIPRELIVFKSEYHYLFSVLHRFEGEASANFSELFILPNIARRFMEVFGGIMIPSYAGLKRKMEKLLPDEAERERVWKFINHYSHSMGAMRALTIPDVSECKAVVKSCLTAVERRDKRHYDALIEAIS